MLRVFTKASMSVEDVEDLVFVRIEKERIPMPLEWRVSFITGAPSFLSSSSKFSEIVVNLVSSFLGATKVQCSWGG